MFDVGINAALLDSDNVLCAAPHDTSIDTAREQLADQLLRSVAPMLDVGMVVITTSNTLGLADHAFLRGAIETPQFTVLLSPDRNARLVDADLQVFGRIAQDETLDKLVTHIEELVKVPNR